jgi:hypothetical protein
MKDVEIYNDNYQNFKPYGIPHAQLIIADPPFNLGNAAYASNPSWYKGGDNKNGESELAGKEFFDTDKNFRPAEFMHFCSQMLVKEPKQGMTDEEYEQAEKIGGGQQSKIKSTVYAFVLRLRPNELLHRAWKALRLYALHSARVPQELLRAGTESQHENCRQLRIRIGAVQRQAT